MFHLYFTGYSPHDHHPVDSPVTSPASSTVRPLSQFSSAVSNSSESESSSDAEDEEVHSHEQPEIVFDQLGTCPVVGKIKMTRLEQRLAAFIYSKGRSTTHSTILSNQKLRLLALLDDECLSVQFFLKRSQWFKVEKYWMNVDEKEFDYIITLINLVPKCVGTV